MQKQDPMETTEAWAEQVVIPTYATGAPDKNPMFLEKRVYQGSSGAVYPLPVIDRVEDEKTDREYTALLLENRYIKVMILPELGGRVQMALDKTNGYHFVYYNRVIKPALVGLCGPWISGGIEFNWPQHHRPSTFDPVDWRIEEHDDGSKSVWCSEIERMYRTKGMAGFRVYPDRALLEVNVQISNRTSVPQSFLWWANPAVHVHEDYQSVFPPDVHAVMDHGKRDVSDFPIATGTYYKVDYSPGTDISRYSTIPVPTSYMAYHSDFDFVGCYDHRAQAGMMHVANHHIVPGKKQWTWGSGAFGQAWDRHLTDEDGPYIELMCGAFTDNQPDFSWLMPGEEKRFRQVFMPYKSIGPATNASREAVVSLNVEEGTAVVGVYVTRPRTVTIRLRHGDTCLFEQAVDLTPEAAFTRRVDLPEEARPQQLTLTVLAKGRTLVEYTPLPEEKPEIPAPATAAPDPETVPTIEELFLHGLHLEQYRHATYSPEAYYEEGLRRDPLDSRCNNAMGLLLYRRGLFTDAESCFRRAIERATMRNPNPYDGEPFYNLGLALRMQGRYDEAYAAFYKATWNEACQATAFFELARLAARKGNYEEGLDLAEKALSRNTNHHGARHLKAAVLRRMGRTDAALATAKTGLDADCLDVGALYEHQQLSGDAAFDRHARGNVHTYIELALDYAHAGLFDEADVLLAEAPQEDPMVHYFRGYFESLQGESTTARAHFEVAASSSPDYCFPHRIECVPALETAMEVNAQDAWAPYYLGNFQYAHRRYEDAITAWERARDLDPAFATTHRNLGLAFMNKKGDAASAREAYEEAFRIDDSDARVFFELDQLYRQTGLPPDERLKRLERYDHLVGLRDDLTLERITLLNLLGRHCEALELLLARRFHPWEGGEGKVTRQYVVSLVALARRALDEEAYDEAIEYLTRAQTYPENLGEGKLYGAQENDVFYYLGCAHDGRGASEEAKRWFDKAAVGLKDPASALYYNDQPPDMIFYQGLARRRLGQAGEADAIFSRLVEYGRKHLNDAVKIDYFAVSLPDFLVFDQDLEQKNAIHCHYMMGLGHLGCGRGGKARQHLNHVLTIDPAHLGATIHQAQLQNGALSSATSVPPASMRD